MNNANAILSIPQALSIAVGYFQAGQMEEAEAVCKQGLAIDSRSPDMLHLMGVILLQTGRYKNAAKFFNNAIKQRNDIPFYYSNLGLALYNQGEHPAAIQQFKRAIAIKPDLFEAYTNLGNAFKAQGMYDESAEWHRKAIAINPEYAEAYYNLGIALQEQGRSDEAVLQYEKALALKPGIAEVYLNLGLALKGRGKLEEAEIQYRKAIALKPDYALAYCNLGAILTDLGKYEAAEAQLKVALALKPEYPQAIYNLSFTYKKWRKYDEALALAEQAVALDPENGNNLTEYVHQLYHLCAWDKTPEYGKRLLRMVRQRSSDLISPFVVFSLPPSTPADHLSSARDFIRKFSPPADLIMRHTQGRARDKIRVAYLSGDLHQHATAHLMAEMFELHDRNRFEISAYSYSKDDGSPMRRRLLKAFDNFIDITPLPHSEAAQKIYNDGIDILIDLKGAFTEGARIGIPARRPAPIQVNYIGYPGSMGTDFIDYILADPFIIPPDQQQFYDEKVVYLPDCYQPNDRSRSIAEATPTRAECNLPEQGFVFCSFNNVYKITPEVYDVWMRLLLAVPGSVLWLITINPVVRRNLRKSAHERGVDPDRLVFAPALPTAEHLARHRLADLFLDSLPVNAHTTASDALWAGLPVVTCAGQAFVGRVAGSLLKTAGLPELITYSLKDYEALALQLAQDPARLAAIRKKLQDTRLQTPLFDTERLVRNVEKAYQTMWDIWQAGEKPRSFSVE